MTFLFGLLIGIFTSALFKSPAARLPEIDVLPKYVTHANRMAKLYRKMPLVSAEFIQLIQTYGGHLPPESKAYFNTAVEQYNNFFGEIAEGWDDMKEISEDFMEFIGEVEGMYS